MTGAASSLYLSRHPLDLLRQFTDPQRVRSAVRNRSQSIGEGQQAVGDKGIGTGWQARPINRKFNNFAIKSHSGSPFHVFNDHTGEFPDVKKIWVRISSFCNFISKTGKRGGADAVG